MVSGSVDRLGLRPDPRLPPGSVLRNCVTVLGLAPHLPHNCHRHTWADFPSSESFCGQTAVTPQVEAPETKPQPVPQLGPRPRGPAGRVRPSSSPAVLPPRSPAPVSCLVPFPTPRPDPVVNGVPGGALPHACRAQQASATSSPAGARAQTCTGP